MTGPNGRPNLDAGACPTDRCERICGPGDLCKCPPCICQRCTARRARAGQRAQMRRGLERAVTDPLALFDPSTL